MGEKPRLSLQWLPQEVDDLRELVEHLRHAIRAAPCLAARPGELTYECRVESPCRVCRWRSEVSEELISDWDMPDGIW